MRQLAEDVEALIDFLTREFLQAVRAEALHSKRAHDGAVEHGTTEDAGCEFGLRCQVTEEATGEAVACACGVDDFFKRQCRRTECGGADVFGRFAEEGGCSVLAVLDNEHARAQLEHGARGLHEVGVAGDHACLGVVDEEDVEPLEHFEQRWLVVFNPVVHRVAGYELSVRRGFTDPPLEYGIDVGEKEEF